MNKYEYFNPHPKGKKTTDCVIRAMSKVLNMTWDETFDNLCVIGKLIKEVPTSMKVIECILKDNKTIPIFHMVGENKKRYKVNDIPFWGALLCRVAGHIVYYDKGTYYDTFDCGKKSLYKAWVIQK